VSGEDESVLDRESGELGVRNVVVALGELEGFGDVHHLVPNAAHGERLQRVALGSLALAFPQPSLADLAEKVVHHTLERLARALPLGSEEGLDANPRLIDDPIDAIDC
jgi:hypothetical protein